MGGDGRTVKLLSCNAGYLLDYTGALSEYVLAPHRAVTGSAAAEARSTDRLVGVIADERPDIVCLLEVDQGSVRTADGGQLARIAARLSERGLTYRTRADSKYGESGLLARAPVLRHLSNGFLLRDGIDGRTEAHYLDTGPKRLVSEVRVGDISVFAVHLAMSGRTRVRQLEELAELTRERERAIVCGDFNAYNGLSEFDDFREETGLVLRNPGETVPKRPLDTLLTDTRSLDVFLTPPDLTVTRCEVVDVQVSDHRPIILEFDADDQ